MTFQEAIDTLCDLGYETWDKPGWWRHKELRSKYAVILAVYSICDSEPSFVVEEHD